MTREELLHELHKTPGYNLARECSAQLRADAATIEKYKRAMLELYAAISRIDYLCGQPNDYECSPFDVDKDEERVVKRVATTIEELQGFRDELAKIPCNTPVRDFVDRHNPTVFKGFSDCGYCPQDRARTSKAKESQG